MAVPPTIAATRTAVISTDRLGRRFGDTVAVHDLSLEVFEGEVFGFLGHNGAGKTTTIRLLTGLLQPSAGSARVLGLSPIGDGPVVRRSTGVLTETPALDERLTARENLTFFARLYGVPEPRTAARVAELLDEFELADRASERVGGYSKGMKQRLALARLLLHDPQLLFLDEPTAGLDPVAARRLHLLIQRLSRERGRTVFLCTHNLVEAEQLCDRVAVLGRGRLLAVGTPAELARRLVSPLEVRVSVGEGEGDAAAATLRGVGGLSPVTVDGGATLTCRAPREQVPEIVRALAAAGTRIFAVTPCTPSLEDVYFALQETPPAEAQP